MCGDEFGQVRAADLFLPFDDEFYIGWKGIGLHHGLKRLYVHIKLPLVVGAATGVDLPVFDDRIERPAMPELEGIGWLYVVMAIDQYSWTAGVGDLLAIDYRVTFRRIDLGFVDTGVEQALFHCVGAFLHVRLVLAAGADGGDTEKLEKFTEETIFIFLLVVLPNFHVGSFCRPILLKIKPGGKQI